MNNSIIVSSLIWKFMERIGTQVIQFIIQIILARLILPDEYGIIAILTIFISIATVFIESGFSTAILQKRETDDLDYDTSFVASLGISIFMYLILFFAAPAISDFYHIEVLTEVLRVSSIILIIGAYNSVQITRITKILRFKKLFVCSLISVIISGIIGITAALLQFGVWALVMQQVSQKIILCLIMAYSLQWHPKLRFSKERFSSLFSFGSKLLVSNLINTIYNNLYGLVIGRVYKAETLGYYNRADQFPNIIVNNINGSLQSVMLPVLSSAQDDKAKVKYMMRRTIKLSAFIVFPLMFGLLACSELVVRVFLTDKWLPSVPFMQLLCVSYSFYPIHTVNLQAINALGRSDIFLKLEIIKKVIGIAILCISIPMGIFYLVASQPLIGIIATFINASPNKRLLNYSFKEQVLDILPTMIVSFIMAGIIILINHFLIFNIYFKLFLDVVVGAVVYMVLTKIFKIDEYHQLMNLLKGAMKNGN